MFELHGPCHILPSLVPLHTVLCPLAIGYFWALCLLGTWGSQRPVDALQDAAEPEPADLLEAIRSSKDLSDASAAQLKSIVEGYTKSFA